MLEVYDTIAVFGIWYNNIGWLLSKWRWEQLPRNVQFRRLDDQVAPREEDVCQPAAREASNQIPRPLGRKEL